MPGVGGGADYQFSLSDIRTKVRAFLMQDADSTHWSDTKLNVYINTALDDLRLAGVKEIGRDSFTTTAGDQEWIPGQLVWRVLSIIYDDQPLTEITREDMTRITAGDWDGRTGIPYHWFVEDTDEGSRITFDSKFPATGTTVKFWYVKRPADLSGDDDVSGLYRVYVTAIVYRVAMLAHASDDNSTTFQMFERLYEQALERARAAHVRLMSPSAVVMHDAYGW